MPYYVPENLAGQSLQDIFRQSESRGEYFPRLDLLSGQLGISPSQKLTTGQSLYGNLAPGSGELQYAQKYFTGTPQVPGLSSTAGGGLNDIVSAAKQIQQFTSEANKPVIQSLEAQREPIKTRYAALLNEIKGQQQVSEQRQSTTTAREFGRRGIPLSSGLYDTTLTEALNPITKSYANLYQQTGAGQEADLLSLAREIANLQAGNPQQALGQALQFGSYQQQAQSLAQQFASQQAQQALAERELSEYKIPSLNKKETVDPYKQYLKVGEGETVFDLSKLQKIFSTPKTYKPTSGNGDWEYV